MRCREVRAPALQGEQASKKSERGAARIERRVTRKSGPSGIGRDKLAGVTYRDEKGALQAKVGELEERLQVAQAENAALRGTSASPDVREGETLGALSGLGTPSSLRIEEVLEGTLSPEGYEAIATLVEKRLRLTSRQVGTKLETNTLPNVGGKVTITVREGRTHLVLEHDWSSRAPSTWLFAGVAAAFGAMATAAVMHDTMHLTDLMSAAQVLWAGPLIAGMAALPIRSRVRRHIETELAADRGTFTAMSELARTHLVAKPRARVELADQDSLDSPAIEGQHDTSREAPRS